MNRWNPHVRQGYLLWTIPSSCWSGEEYGEDMLHVYRYEDGSWDAHTEMDQCVKRDLDDEQITSIRTELGLDAMVSDYVRP